MDLWISVGVPFLQTAMVLEQFRCCFVVRFLGGKCKQAVGWVWNVANVEVWKGERRMLGNFI